MRKLTLALVRAMAASAGRAPNRTEEQNIPVNKVSATNLLAGCDDIFFLITVPAFPDFKSELKVMGSMFITKLLHEPWKDSSQRCYD